MFKLYNKRTGKFLGKITPRWLALSSCQSGPLVWRVVVCQQYQPPQETTRRQTRTKPDKFISANLVRMRGRH